MKSKKFISIILTVLLMLSSSTSAIFAAANAYVHNPVLNEIAMEDIIQDSAAVYGFRPDPNSVRLGPYAKFDWSDTAVVEAARQERIAYHESFSQMYDLWNSMLAEGADTQSIARAVSGLRNQLRIDSYKDNPEGLEALKQSNLAKYGNENGPTADSLYEKYGSWDKVLLKSFSENPGMDACLGLYDIYYDYYGLTKSISENSIQTYTVIKGDNLSKIASKYFGNYKLWNKIYKPNAKMIKNPNLIYPGQVLQIVIE